MTRTGDCLLWSITRLWLMLYHCQDMLLNKTLIGRWCETSWQSCGVNVITMLQYAFSVHVLQMITCSMGEFRCFPCCQPGHAAEQTVERSVILKRHDAHVRHCNNNAANLISALQTVTSPIRNVGCFLCCQPGHAVEENSRMADDLKRHGAHMASLLNNATKWDFGITNDYFFN